MSRNSLVKCVNQCLATLPISGVNCCLAIVDGNLVGITSVDELVTDELSDDARVQRRAVLEICADGLERVFSASVKDTESNLGHTTLIEIGGGRECG